MAAAGKKTKLAARLEQLRNKNKGGGDKRSDVFLKSPTDGSKLVLRQVPYIHDEEAAPFFEAYWHYNIPGQRPILCPSKTYGDPCPICDFAEELRSTGSKDAWELFKKIQAKLRAYSPVIVRDSDNPTEVKLWGFGVQIYESLLEKFTDPKWGVLSDPTTGRDVEIWSVPKDDPSNDTSYDQPHFDIYPSQSKMLPKKADIEAVVKGMKNFLEDTEAFPVKTYQELKDIVRKFANDEPEDEEDTDFNFGKNVEVDVDTDTDSDDSDIDDRLTNLLG